MSFSVLAKFFNFVDQWTGLPLLASEAVEGAVVAGTAAAGAGAAAEDIAELAVEVVTAAAAVVLDDGTYH